MSNSYVCNCLIKARKGETTFTIDPKRDEITVSLNGYVIMPLEDYYNEQSILTIWNNPDSIKQLHELITKRIETQTKIEKGVFP